MGESDIQVNVHIDKVEIEGEGATSTSEVSKNESKIQFTKIRSTLIENSATSLKKGDTWYLVESHWYKQLQRYFGLKRGYMD